MNGRLFDLIGSLILLSLSSMCHAQDRGSVEGTRSNQGSRAVYVERFPNGYALIRYSGTFAKEFVTMTGREAEDVVILFDGASRPVYALRPTTGETIELYKVVRKSNRDLIYAIPVGPYETRVYMGPFHPEEGFPKRLTNLRAVPDIDEAYLKPSAQQKVLWLEETPNLGALKLQHSEHTPADGFSESGKGDLIVRKGDNHGTIRRQEQSPHHIACQTATNQVASSDRNIRIQARGSFERSCSVQELLDLVTNDSRPHVRIDAASVLMNTRNVDVAPALIQLLRSTEGDGQDNFPEFVIQYLALSHDTRAVPVLIEKLEQEQNFQVRTFAAWALGELRDVRAVKPLVLAVAGRDGHYYSMGGDALDPLVNIGPAAVAPLMEMFREPQFDDRYVKMAIASALGRLRDPVAIPLLYEMMESGDPDLEYAANRALDYMDSEELRKWEAHRKAIRIAVWTGGVVALIGLIFATVLIWRKRKPAMA